jgi:hypothetical protein
MASPQAPLGHGLARPWPGFGQARPGNIFLEMMVNKLLITDQLINHSVKQKSF